jgi:flagellar M-ring protein FliF
LGAIVDQIARILLQAGPVRLLAALGVTGLVAALLFAIMFGIGREEQALLYAELPAEEAAAVSERLDQAGITYQLRSDGSSIFVARSDVGRARMLLAADGLPGKGSVGYEIFDKQDALGQTSFVQNINRVRALQGELERTIMSLDGMRAAKVLLVLPERRLFTRENDDPSASITVRTATGQLSQTQARSIRNLVATAVPGLKPERVTIVDEQGRLIASGAEGVEAAGAAYDERKAAVEARLKQTVTEIVERVVGPGAANVQVSADLDFNRTTQQSETFDPDGQVVRSQTTVEETGRSQERDSAGAVSASANIPGGAAGQADAPVSQNDNSRTQETIAYDISSVKKTEVLETGRIKRLSVAVAVDDVVTPGADGAPPAFTARSQQDLQRIEALVRSAIGFSEERGDQVTVVNARFARTADPAVAQSPGLLDQFRSSDLMRGAEIGALLLAALALVFFVLRPLVTGLVRGGVAAQAGPAVGVAGAPALSAPAGAAASDLQFASLPPSAVEERIDIARIQGQVKASSVKRVAEVVDQHPDQSMNILRAMMNDAA